MALLVGGDPDKFPALLVRGRRGSRRGNAGPFQIPALIPYVTRGEYQQATAEMHLPQNSCNAALQSRLSGTQSPNLLLPPTHDIASHRFHLISPFVRGAIITTAIINKICGKIPWLLCSPTKEFALQSLKFRPQKSW